MKKHHHRGHRASNLEHGIFVLYEPLIELELSDFQFQLESLHYEIVVLTRNRDWNELHDIETSVRVWEAFDRLAQVCRGEGETETEDDTRPYLPRTKAQAVEISNPHLTTAMAYRWEEEMALEHPAAFALLQEQGIATDVENSSGLDFRNAWETLKMALYADWEDDFFQHQK
jgi:hypothetical protein